MIALKQTKHLKNIKADVEVKDWSPVPLHNSVPDSSEAGAPAHIYLTTKGIIFWRPQKSVVIPLDELKALVKEVEPEFCSPPPPKQIEVKGEIKVA